MFLSMVIPTIKFNIGLILTDLLTSSSVPKCLTLNKKLQESDQAEKQSKCYKG